MIKEGRIDFEQWYHLPTDKQLHPELMKRATSFQPPFWTLKDHSQTEKTALSEWIGGLRTWVENSLASNPHIQAGETNTHGTIHSAQAITKQAGRWAKNRDVKRAIITMMKDLRWNSQVGSQLISSNKPQQITKDLFIGQPTQPQPENRALCLSSRWRVVLQEALLALIRQTLGVPCASKSVSDQKTHSKLSNFSLVAMFSAFHASGSAFRITSRGSSFIWCAVSTVVVSHSPLTSSST